MGICKSLQAQTTTELKHSVNGHLNLPTPRDDHILSAENYISNGELDPTAKPNCFSENSNDTTKVKDISDGDGEDKDKTALNDPYDLLVSPSQFVRKPKKQLLEPIIQKKDDHITEKRDFKLHLEEFKDIDNYSRQTPKAAEKSVDILASYLTKHAKTDIEKVRALFVWVCENISYDRDFLLTGDRTHLPEEAEEVLKRKMCVCSGYQELFRALCQSVGIQCKELSGYTKSNKDVEDPLSYITESTHAWNAVWLNNEWKLVDTTWGAGYTDQNNYFHRELNDYYFLTKPKYLINSHFPYMDNNEEDSSKWQCLEKPITLDYFIKSVKLSKAAIEFGVKFPRDPFSVIKMEYTKLIEIRTKPGSIHDIWLRLKDKNGSDCSKLAMIFKISDSKFQVTVRPDHNDRYILKICAKMLGHETSYELVQYTIDCVSCELQHKQYPKNSGYYGPQANYVERGFAFPKKVKPFYICENGELEIQVKTIRPPMCFVNLYNACDEKINDFKLVERTEKSINMKMRFLNAGYFKLAIYSKDKESDERYDEALKILIRNFNPSTIMCPFPETFTQTDEYKCRLISPLTRNIPANSKVTIKLRSSKLKNILIKKNKLSRGDSNIWELDVETSESGKLTIYGRVQSEGRYSGIYRFVVK